METTALPTSADVRVIVGGTVQQLGVETIGLAQYVDPGNASTDDLRQVMQKAAGGQDLGWFFAEWLTRSGVPQVSGSWRYDAAAKQIVVHHVAGSSLPNWLGTEQVRHYAFSSDGKQLTLSLKNGDRITQTLTWERTGR